MNQFTPTLAWHHPYPKKPPFEPLSNSPLSLKHFGGPKTPQCGVLLPLGTLSVPLLCQWL